jgi:hypothetical protein
MLEELIRDLFLYLCSFLDIDDLLVRLKLVNKKIYTITWQSDFMKMVTINYEYLNEKSLSNIKIHAHLLTCESFDQTDIIELLQFHIKKTYMVYCRPTIDPILEDIVCIIIQHLNTDLVIQISEIRQKQQRVSVKKHYEGFPTIDDYMPWTYKNLFFFSAIIKCELRPGISILCMLCAHDIDDFTQQFKTMCRNTIGCEFKNSIAEFTNGSKITLCSGFFVNLCEYTLYDLTICDSISMLSLNYQFPKNIGKTIVFQLEYDNYTNSEISYEKYNLDFKNLDLTSKNKGIIARYGFIEEKKMIK